MKRGKRGSGKEKEGVKEEKRASQRASGAVSV